MKIVHLVHNFPPEFRGGTELYLRKLCRLQIEGGHEVTVIAGSERRDWCDDFVEETFEGIRVLRFLRLPEGEAFTADFYLERFEGLFAGFLGKEKPDLVHLHHWMNLGHELLRVAAGMGVPSVLTLHDLYPLCPRFFMTRPDGQGCGPEPVLQEQCLECLIEDYEGSPGDLEGDFRIRKAGFEGEFAAARVKIVPSLSHALPFKEAGLLKEDDYQVVHHGLVRAVSKAVWTSNHEGPLRVGTWGNLVPAKGIHVLLAALRAWDDDLEGKVEVHLHGQVIDPDYEKELRALAEGYPVFFHGDFSDRSMEEVGKDLDLAVFPSLARESYSMVLDEAVALGLPVVVSDAGALPERVGEGGIVVPAGDGAALAGALRDLESHREKLEVLSAAIREQVWTVEDNHRRLEELYGSAMEAGPAAVACDASVRRTALLRGRIAAFRHEQEERSGSFLRFSKFREFVPLRDFAGVPAGKVVVLSPHPDDEVIGCGGAMALHGERGDEVVVVHLTDGSSGGRNPGEALSLSQTRKGEAAAAGKILGTARFMALDRKDGRLLPDEETVQALQEIVEEIAPAVVYAPSPFEIHPDHMAALFLALQLLEHHEPGFSLFLYEVNEAMVPGFLIDITSVREKKDQALACFESQIPLNDVRDKSMSGARWRTANVDLVQVTHAEAFIEAHHGTLRGLMARTKEVVRYIGSDFKKTI